ncbi:MAG: hypothetical protein HQK50_17930, partial [Oligoflexia bacterium]|nr:hypothetical protein [Oligoflexia bacterium]
MNIKNWFHLLWAGVLLLVQATYGANLMDPKLSSDEERVAYLLYLKAQVPDLFAEAATYGVDLFKILQKQEDLLQKLKDHQEYNLSQQKRAELVSIDIKAKQDTKTVTMILDPEALKVYRQKLIDFASHELEELEDLEDLDGKDKITLKEYLSKKIKSSMAEINFNTDLLLPSIVQEIDSIKKNKNEFMHKSFEEKMKELEQALKDPLQDSLKKFNFKAYGLSNEISAKDFIDALKRNHDGPEKIKQLLTLAIFLQEQWGSDNENYKKQEVLAELGRLDESRLDYLKEEANLIKVLGEFVPEKVTDKAMKKNSLAKMIAADYTSLSNKKVALVEKSVGQLTLKEVPPYIGIYRGFVGGDCSSDYSALYANGPSDRVFFIYDDKGKVKGYAAGTIVDVQGEPAFYLHTIAGKKLGGKETTLILEGLSQEIKALSANKLVLPQKDKVSSLINYSAIKETILSNIAGKTVIPITYRPLDQQIRSAFLDPTSKAAYDQVATNTHCLIYEKNEKMGKLETTTTPAIFSPFSKEDKGDKLDRFLFALDLASIDREDTALKILKEFNINDIAKVKKINKLLHNRDHQSLGKYVAILGGVLKEHGIHFKEALERRGDLFDIGILNASDSMSESNSARSSKIFSKMYKKEEFEELNKIFLGSDQKYSALNNNTSFKNQFLKLCSKFDHQKEVTDEELNDFFEDLTSVGTFPFLSHELVQACVNLLAKDSEILFSKLRLFKQGVVPFLPKIPQFVEKITQAIHQGTVDKEIAWFVLSQPHWKEHPEWVEALIKKGTVDKEIAQYVLSKPHWNEHPELVEALIKKGTVDKK